MHSMAPRPCFFMRSRARSVRYFFNRSQLTRCCQSNPGEPKFGGSKGPSRPWAQSCWGKNGSLALRLWRQNYFILIWPSVFMIGCGMVDIALRQVRAVIAVCEEGSFTRAAERENATQSGISQHVAAVERALGVKLFERSARGIVPTPAGLRYYKSCIE